MKFWQLFIPAIIACLCNTIANTLWKMRFAGHPMDISSISAIWQMTRDWRILLGIVFYGCSMMLFFFMLSHFKLSMIMPVTCLTYVFNIIVAYLVFHEAISPWQMIGTAVIISGLLMVAQSPV